MSPYAPPGSSFTKGVALLSGFTDYVAIVASGVLVNAPLIPQSALTNAIIAPRAGTITSLITNFNLGKTAGTMSVRVGINGAFTTIGTIAGTGASGSFCETFTGLSVAFAAGASIQVVWTTDAGMLPNGTMKGMYILEYSYALLP